MCNFHSPKIHYSTQASISSATSILPRLRINLRLITECQPYVDEEKNAVPASLFSWREKGRLI